MQNLEFNVILTHPSNIYKLVRLMATVSEQFLLPRPFKIPNVLIRGNNHIDARPCIEAKWFYGKQLSPGRGNLEIVCPRLTHRIVVVL